MPVLGKQSPETQETLRKFHPSALSLRIFIWEAEQDPATVSHKENTQSPRNRVGTGLVQGLEL